MSRLKKIVVLSSCVAALLAAAMVVLPGESSGKSEGCVVPGFFARLLNQAGLGAVMAAPGPCTKHPVNTTTEIGYQCDSLRSNCTDANGKHGVCQNVYTNVGGFPLPVDCACTKLDRSGGHGHGGH